VRHVTAPQRFLHTFVHPIILTITNQEFLTSPKLQHSVRDNIQSILNDLDIQPMWHPMRRGYWYFLIKVSENIRKQIDALETWGNANTNDLGPEYWAFIWEIATTAKGECLEILARRILKFVIPSIEQTYEDSKLARRLRMEDKNSAQAPVQVQPPTPRAPTRGCPYGRPRGSGKGGRRERPREGGTSAVTNDDTARAPRRDRGRPSLACSNGSPPELSITYT
jgi:hypothetical protein